MHFADQNLVPETVYCISYVMVCKNGLTNRNAKIELLRASLFFTYYIKLFPTGSDRHDGILMPLLVLVAETIIIIGHVNTNNNIDSENIWILWLFRLIKTNDRKCLLQILK